jgi:phenylacetate-coenzyme A ligase PaaK-like adenylate-forming protein
MFSNKKIETMDRSDLDALIEKRIRYTVKYASENSPFYKKWFKEHRINPHDVRTHEDLRELPIISGKTIREHQPPETPDFQFRSVDWSEVFTLHETSGTSGTPKTFFLTWQDWERYAEKYARSFVSQGFGPGDRVVVCASYGMNVGANTMTLAAREVGMTIIPLGKCAFPSRVLKNYKPTGIVGSVFKLLGLARQLKNENILPPELTIKRLVVGGESFADESRAYLAEVWGCPVYNTYGSTEGTMCGECTDLSGLHVPEDLVHLDIYDPALKNFVRDGECGRTHMKIMNPQRESETFWVAETPFNRVDVERGVFQRENMEYLTGEYEAFLYGGDDEEETIMRVSVECLDRDKCDRKAVEENFIRAFFIYKPLLKEAYTDGIFKIIFNFAALRDLELHRIKGRPKRIVDRR